MDWLLCAARANDSPKIDHGGTRFHARFIASSILFPGTTTDIMQSFLGSSNIM